MADLEPVIGHEQGRRRSVAVVSRDALGRWGLAIVVPFTTKDVGSPLHLRVEPPEGGLPEVSFALPQHVRAISSARLMERLGTIRLRTHEEIVRRIDTLVRPG